MLTRRQLIIGTPATLLTTAIAGKAFAGTIGVNDAQAAQPAPAAGPFTLPPLGYAVDALEPHIDAQTMTIHHDRHHQTYVTNLNNAVATAPELKTRSVEDLVQNLASLPASVQTAVRNSGGGHLNHTMFWTSLKKGGGVPPSAELGRAITAAFGSFDALKTQLTNTATGVFGSGWAWLSLDPAGKLIVEPSPNQDNPITKGNTPLLGIDVWEHAYYLKYQNRRKDYVDAIFNVIDWDVVQQRFAAKK
ncbi:MAG: superoxide dismutase [Acidobacteria bacterium]|nr:MAG: superoxide dismutase [Acidobacteriota bacterium]